MKRVKFLVPIFLLMLAAVACTNQSSQETVSTSENNTQNVQEAAAGEAPDLSNEVQPAASEQNKPVASETQNNEQQETEEENSEEIMKISVKSADYEIIYELNDGRAAKDLYEQLPLTVDVEPFSTNEITFYPEALSTDDTPLASGDVGSLAYYAPWGDVVMFYGPCDPNGSLYELGMAVSGAENIEKLTGSVTVSVCE